MLLFQRRRRIWRESEERGGECVVKKGALVGP